MFTTRVAMWLQTATSPRIFTGLAVSVLFLAWLIFPKPFFLSDMVLYLERVKLLHDISNWEWSLPFDHRLALIALHWPLVHFLGITPEAVYLPQLLLLIGLTVAALTTCNGPVERVTAFAVILLLVPQTTRMLPDLGCALFVFLAILGLCRRDRPLNGLVFAVCAFLAMLFKLTAYFVAVPFLFALIIDASRRQIGHLAFYIASILAGLMLLAAYFFFYATIAGDPFARLNTLNAFAEEHYWAIQSTGDLIRRLFIHPTAYFHEILGYAFFIATLGSLALAWQRGHRDALAWAWLAFVLLFTFGSVSLTRYEPLPFADRMLAFFVPLAAILSAATLTAIRADERILPTPRALITILVVGLLAHHSLTVTAATYARLAASELDPTRRKIVAMMQEHPDLQLVVAEERTRDAIDIYTGFSGEIGARTVVCPPVPLNEGEASEGIIVLVDYGRAAFLGKAYGSSVCAEELSAQARQLEDHTLTETSELLVAYPPQRQQ